MAGFVRFEQSGEMHQEFTSDRQICLSPRPPGIVAALEYVVYLVWVQWGYGLHQYARVGRNALKHVPKENAYRVRYSLH